jgi:hypothetical protein
MVFRDAVVVSKGRVVLSMALKSLAGVAEGNIQPFQGWMFGLETFETIGQNGQEFV